MDDVAPMRGAWLLLVILVLSCAGWQSPAVDDAAGLPVDLSELRLSFVHPETLSRYTVEGPYDVIRVTAERVELQGRDGRFFERVPLVVFEREQSLWVLARVGGHEFLTRLQ